MKKIGVISDTHGDILAIDRCIEKAPDVDMWFHLGDLVPDAETLETRSGKPVYAVKGNCDLGFPVPKKQAKSETVITVEDTKIFLIHGHLYGVGDHSPMRAVYRAEELSCGVLLYGHTHVSEVDKYGPLLIVNPGSPSRPRQGRKPSFALLTVDGSNAGARIVTL